MENNLKKVDIIFEVDENNTPYDVLLKTLKRPADEIILDLIDSGLKGRGGAATAMAMSSGASISRGIR